VTRGRGSRRRVLPSNRETVGGAGGAARRGTTALTLDQELSQPTAGEKVGRRKNRMFWEGGSRKVAKPRPVIRSAAGLEESKREDEKRVAKGERTVPGAGSNVCLEKRALIKILL